MVIIWYVGGWLLAGLVGVVFCNYDDHKPGTNFKISDAFKDAHTAVFGLLLVVLVALSYTHEHAGPLVICRKPLPKGTKP